PFVNWTLMVAVILLVLAFKSSSNLAAAYGLAVTGAMLIASVLIAVVLFQLWHWTRVAATLLLLVFFTVDLGYFGANATKIPAGGWGALVIAGIVCTLLSHS